MKIVASHDLDGVALVESEPVLYQWSWFDSKPTLPLWFGLGVLLLLPQNRKWQAWLILIAPGLAASVQLLTLIPQLGISNSSDIGLLLQLFVTLSFAWTAVWLLGPQLSSGGRPRAFFVSFVLMAAVGLTGYLAYFGFWIDGFTSLAIAVYYSAVSLALLTALMLSGLCCRRSFRTRSVALWLMLWLPVVTVTSMSLMFGIVILTDGGPMSDVAMQIMAISTVAVCAAGCLYAMNLPLLILAGTTDCYRERLRTMVYREKRSGTPFSEETLDENETAAT